MFLETGKRHNPLPPHGLDAEGRCRRNNGALEELVHDRRNLIFSDRHAVTIQTKVRQVFPFFAQHTKLCPPPKPEPFGK
jgi:hypothetical protein